MKIGETYPTVGSKARLINSRAAVLVIVVDPWLSEGTGEEISEAIKRGNSVYVQSCTTQVRAWVSKNDLMFGGANQ